MKVVPLILKTLKERKREKKRRSYFYVSEAGKTPYEIFKALLGYQHISPRMQRVFDNGVAVHERIMAYLEKQGVVKAKEVKIRNKLFHGRADAIIYSDGRVAVLEVKSMNRDDFEKLRRFCDRKTYLQVQLYMHFLKIDEGIILVECKNDQRLKELQIKRKPRTARQLIKNFSRLKKRFVEAGVMIR